MNCVVDSELRANIEAEAKTVAENWDSKAPSFGTILAYLETTA